jgi:hypothetical protein
MAAGGLWGVRGLVFGAFGEASEEVHGLVHHMANRILKSEGLQQGRETLKGELGKIWRMISVASDRSELRCRMFARLAETCGKRSWGCK